MPAENEGLQSYRLAERVRHELRNYAIVAGYLYVCFGVLLL
jgi:hypothetical protein